MFLQRTSRRARKVGPLSGTLQPLQRCCVLRKEECSALAEAFDRLLAEAEHATFSGWDFSWLQGRLVEERDNSWDYPAIVRDAFRGVRSVLDLGTGGGERLSALSPLPPETYATESYALNVPLARARLEPLGVRVVATGSEDEVPFEDAMFDLVIDRHTGAPATEIHRVLRAGGRYITEQVGSGHYWELIALLRGEDLCSPPPSSLGPFRRQLEEGGLHVTDARECYPSTRVLDVGAIVYYLHAIPWVVPEFSMESHRGRLRTIHERIQACGELRLTGHYLLLAASK